MNNFITIFIITDTESKPQYPLTSSTPLPATFSYAVTSSLSDTTISPTPIVTKGIWAKQKKELVYVFVRFMFGT